MRSQALRASNVPAPAGGLLLQRSCGCGGTCGSCGEAEQEKKTLRRSPARGSHSRFGHDFSRVPATRSIDVRVGPADDAYEREADRVAEAIVAGQPTRPQHVAPARLQRQEDDEAPLDATDEASEEEDVVEGGDEDEIEDNPTGQPQFDPGAPAAGGRARVPVGQGGGAPLASGLRASLEQGFGHDFGSVRVHADGEGARAAESVHARAFTVGSDIYFAAGRYEPSSMTGQRLLAHELTHVVQQSGETGGLAQRQPKGGKDDKKPAKKKPTGKTADKKTPAKKKKDTFCDVHGRQGKKPCGPSGCDGTCASPTNKFTHNPCCGNETCSTSGPSDPSFFIRHLDVNLKTQMVVAEWGSKAKTLAVSTFLSSPNPTATPVGPHTIGIKCGACHTNGDGDGMAWFTSFANGLQFGFHNSQAVAKGTHSHGCVRVGGSHDCDCAHEIHDNTDSGTTSVCIHTGKNCGRKLPTPGAVHKGHTSVCGTLHDVAAPAPKGSGGGGSPKDDAPKPAPPKADPPPEKKTPSKDLVSGLDGRRPGDDDTEAA